MDVDIRSPTTVPSYIVPLIPEDTHCLVCSVYDVYSKLVLFSFVPLLACSTKIIHSPEKLLLFLLNVLWKMLSERRSAFGKTIHCVVEHSLKATRLLAYYLELSTARKNTPKSLAEDSLKLYVTID